MANHPNRRLRGSLHYFAMLDEHGLCKIRLFVEPLKQTQPPRDPYAEIAFFYDGKRVASPPWLVPRWELVQRPAMARRWLSQPRYGFDCLAAWAEQHLRIRGTLPSVRPVE